MSKVVIHAVGDIFLQQKNSGNPFENVKHVFKKNDILFGNLEAPLTNAPLSIRKAVSLVANPENISYLKDVGFHILNISNNHILDSGPNGLKETIELLKENDIQYIGANDSKDDHTYRIIKKNNLRFAFLGYTTGRFKIPHAVIVNKLVKKNILEDVKKIKNECDFIIVSLHWGIENVFYPSPEQIDFAHTLIDNGVSLILGHHPHVLQGIEEFNNGLIIYSLGNFQFFPFIYKSNTNETIILSVEFDENGIKKYDIIPVKIDKNYLPYVVDEEKEKKEMLDFIDDISKQLNTQRITKKWWYEEIAQTYLSNNIRSYKKRIKKYGIKPFIECIVWLVTPFCINCYLGLVRKRLFRRKENRLILKKDVLM